jgi:hypothetical protein
MRPEPRSQTQSRNDKSKMTLAELKSAAGDLAALSHGERIKLFGWWLHTHKSKAHFAAADIGRCYDELHLARPGSFGGYFANLEGKDLLRSASGYRLSGPARDAFDAAHGAHKQKLPIKTLLKDLPSKLPNLVERKYLDEAYTCYENEAFRATVVMVWNLAYAHLCDHIVKNRLADFNAQWLKDHSRAHKNGVRTIKTVDDFNDEELKENTVLKLALDAGIIVKNVYNILEPALKKRNMAAHPNNVVIDPAILDGFISDVINNAVLKI